MKNAVIVAAGKSSRLYPLTLDCPKGLLEINSERILERSVRQLKEAGVEKIFIVVGYLYEKIEQVFDKDPSVEFIRNPFFEHCNNMGSLWFALKRIISDRVTSFLYLHADLVYDDVILKNFLQFSKNKVTAIDLAVDFKAWDEESMKVMLGDKMEFLMSSKDISATEASGEWIGIAAIKNPLRLCEVMEQILLKEGLNFYDTYSFSKSDLNKEVEVFNIGNAKWVEVDFLSDFKEAQVIFND